MSLSMVHVACKKPLRCILPACEHQLNAIVCFAWKAILLGEFVKQIASDRMDLWWYEHRGVCHLLRSHRKPGAQA